MEKLKLKHNKKRNTAFLFESLTKELTKAIVNKVVNPIVRIALVKALQSFSIK